MRIPEKLLKRRKNKKGANDKTPTGGRAMQRILQDKAAKGLLEIDLSALDADQVAMAAMHNEGELVLSVDSLKLKDEQVIKRKRKTKAKAKSKKKKRGANKKAAKGSRSTAKRLPKKSKSKKSKKPTKKKAQAKQLVKKKKAAGKGKSRSIGSKSKEKKRRQKKS